MAAPIALAFRIAANLSELRANLSDLKGQLETTKKAMQTMTSAFDGSRIIADANAAVKVVTDLGGATTLTTKEQQRLNAMVTEAIAKYEALGQEAPDALHAMQAQTNQVVQTVGQLPPVLQNTTSRFDDLVSQTKATVLGFVSAQAIIGGVSSAFKGLVGFVESSIDSYASAEAAAKKMTVALDAQGNATPETIAAFNALATQFQRTTVYSDDLINEMESLLTQVGNVAPSQMEKALRATTDLASGLGIDLQSATMLVAKAFAGGGDELGRLKAILGDAYQPGMDMAQVLEVINSKFGGQAAAEAQTYAGQIKQIANEWDNVKESVGGAIAQDPLIISALRATKEAAQGTAEGTGLMNAAWSAFKGASPGVLQSLSALHSDLTDAADAANTLAEAAARMNAIKPPTAFAGLGGQFAEWDKQSKKFFETTVDGWMKADKAAQEFADKVTAAFRKWSGADLAEQAKILDITFRKLADTGQITGQQVEAMATEAAKLAEQGAVLSPRLWDIVMATGALDPPLVKGTAGITNLGAAVELQIPKLSAFNEAVLAMNATLGKADASLTAFTSIGEKLPALKLPTVPPGMFESLFGTPQQMGAYVSSSILSAVQGGGNVVGAAGGAIGQQLGSNIAKTLSKSLTDAGSGLFSQALGGIFEAVLPGVGALIGPLASKLWDGLKSVFDRDKGRDLVKDFADSLGGFDAPGGLHAQLLAVGEAGEAMWIRLTQQVGRNDQEGARAAIAAATELLKKHKDEVTAGAAAQEAAAASIAASNAAAIQSAQQAIKDLDGQISSLNQSIANEAPEEEMGVIEKNTRAQIASLEAQRKEASKSLEALTAQAADSMQNVADAIKDLPDEIAVKLRVELETHTRGGDSGGAVPMAEGGDFLVTRPTLFLVGEAGPERATFSGAGKTSHSSSGMDSRLLGEIKQLLRDQPRAMAIAIQDAMALGGAR